MATTGYAQIGGPYTDTTWQTWTTTTATTATTAWTRWAGDGTSASVTEGIWQTWATNTTTTASDTQGTWSSWVDQTQDGRPVVQRGRPVPIKQTMAVISPEQIAADRARMEARRLEWVEKEKVRHEKQTAAKAKAERLLIAHLNEEQARSWVENRTIFVTSQSGKRYRIKEGYAHNIHSVDAEDTPIRELCVHIDQMCPRADNVLAQMLGLRFNEAALLRKANVWDLTQNRLMVHRSDN